MTLKRVGKVENWNWKTFAVQTILQKQANTVKVAKGSRSDSSENARNRSEILRGPAKKKFRQIAWKLTELEPFPSILLLKKTVQKGKRLNWKESLTLSDACYFPCNFMPEGVLITYSQDTWHTKWKSIYVILKPWLIW